MNPPWIAPTKTGACRRHRPQLEPLEERLPPGETWGLLAWSWWGWDLVSLNARAERIARPSASPLPESNDSAAASSALVRPDMSAASRSTALIVADTPGLAPGGAVPSPMSSAASLGNGKADSFAQVSGLASWDGTPTDRPLHSPAGGDGFTPRTPLAVGSGAAPALPVPPAPAWPQQTEAPTVAATAGLSPPRLLNPARSMGQDHNLPPPPSHRLTVIGYSLGQPVLDTHSFGDTWGPAWSLDGQLYTASDDSAGFDNAVPDGYDIVSNRLTGDPSAGTLHGVTLAGLTAYGGPSEGCYFQEGCDNWKATNMTSVNGVLYLSVTITSYVDQGSLQPQHNASIIKSDNSDGLGLGHTWAPSHGYANDPTTMWPDTPAFSAPYFVDYGQDPGIAGNPAWPDGADQYVYAVSTDAAVRNASNLYLGRVPRDQIGNLRADDWSFVTGFNTHGQPVWGSVNDATPVLGVLRGDNTAGRLGWTTVEWAAPIQKYILTEWYYPNPRYECPGDPAGSCQSTSRWVMYQADHVWGPWQQFGPEFTWAPGNPSSQTEGDYFPVVPTRFMDPQIDTTVYPYQWHAWVLTTGDYWDPDMYRLTAVPLTLDLVPAPPKEPATSV